jgi:glucokinase
VPVPIAEPVVLAADLGGTKCHAVLADRGGVVLDEDYRRSDGSADPADVLLAALDDLRHRAAEAGRSVAGVAIGVPGLLDPASGRVAGGFNLNWDGFDLGARLSAGIPEPWLVENDVNLAALGEAQAGAGRGAQSFAVVSLGTGLGGAVVVDGKLLRGAHGAAGEFGFLLTGREQLRRREPMAMETLVGGRSIATRAGTDPAVVFAAAAAGDGAAGQVVDELLDHVAMAIVDIAAVLDPERVVLDGSVGRALVPYLPRLTALLAPVLLFPPELRISTLAPNAALAGAVGEAWRVADTAGQPSSSSTSRKR